MSALRYSGLARHTVRQLRHGLHPARPPGDEFSRAAASSRGCKTTSTVSACEEHPAPQVASFRYQSRLVRALRPSQCARMPCTRAMTLSGGNVVKRAHRGPWHRGGWLISPTATGLGLFLLRCRTIARRLSVNLCLSRAPRAPRLLLSSCTPLAPN